MENIHLKSQFDPARLKGLSEQEVAQSRLIFGPNTQYQGRKNTWWTILLGMFKEPMLILLILISVI